ncbi:MAG: ArnT family glycosyltransferase [Gemmataceae bacterium]
MERRPRISLHGVRKVLSYNVWRGIRSLPSWWTHSGFPGQDKNQHDVAFVTPTKSARVLSFLAHLILLLVVSSLLFFTRISAPLLEPEEARYAEIPREMLDAGHFVVPLLQGHEYYHKPPVLYWLVMTSYHFLGVDDWTARIVPGVIGVSVILLLFCLGQGPMGTRGAFVSAVVLSLTIRFTYLARMLGMDAVLTLFVLAGLLGGYRALGHPRIRWGWWIVSAVSCGLGILTKGPVAFVLVGVPLLLLQVLDRRVARPGIWPWFAYVTMTAVVALPWYVFLFCHNSQAVIQFFWLHNVVRFVQPFDHAKPFWFYLPSLLLGTLPWSLLAFPIFRFLRSANPRTASRRQPVLGFFLLAGLWCLLFYSLSGCKRAVYILPALPSFAIVAGVYLANGIPWRRVRLFRWSTWYLPARSEEWAHTSTVGILVVGASLAYLAVQVRLWEEQHGTIAKCVLLSAVLLLAIFRPRMSEGASWVLCVMTLLAIEMGAIYFLLPRYNRRFSLRGQLRRHQELCRRSDVSVVCYPRLYDSVNYYLRRTKVRTFRSEQIPELMSHLQKKTQTLVVVRKGKDLDKFLSRLPAGLRFTHHKDDRARVCVGIVTHCEKLPSAAHEH